MWSYHTVAETIPAAARLRPHHGFIFQDPVGRETLWSFPEIDRETMRRLGRLQALGLQKGDRLGMVVIEPEDFVLSFLAALRGGIVPVPLYPPLSLRSLDAYAERTERILRSAGARLLLTSGSLKNICWQHVDRVPSLERLVPVEQLCDGAGQPRLPEIAPDDIAFLQYTSGSTADPKGVMVSHASLVANAKGIVGHGLRAHPDRDFGVSWLPLYHDMGLIGFVVSALASAIGVCFIPTVRFIKNPNIWLDTAHRHRATISFAPNFAYALAARAAKRSELSRWDLSCLRVLGCGAEPIHPSTLRAFTELFHRCCGLPRTALLPAYGIAEATLAVTMKPLEQEFRTLEIDGPTFQEHHLVTGPHAASRAVEHVSCGVPFPGHELQIRDEAGRVLPDDTEGEVCVRGPSVTPGYFEDPASTAATFTDGWLRTGDLGYLRDRELYVTGRIKDLIILYGRNLHPQAIEWTVGEVDGVRKGNVVAFSRPGADSEELVIVLETRSPDHPALAEAVRQTVGRVHALVPADVRCLAPGTLPKTSSGKLQRHKTRNEYLAGRLGIEGSRQGGATDRVKLVKHITRSLWTRAKTAAAPR